MHSRKNPRLPPRVEALKGNNELLPSYSVSLGEATQDVVRDLWWRLNRHHGEKLPPEPGLIILRGGRDD